MRRKTGLELGLTPFEANRLVHRYGTNIDIVYDIIRKGKEEAGRTGLSLEVYGALRYGIEYEMVVTLSDFFIRRTGALYFDIDWVDRWKNEVTNYMADIFNWSTERLATYREELDERIVEATQVEETQAEAGTLFR